MMMNTDFESRFVQRVYALSTLLYHLLDYRGAYAYQQALGI